MEPIISPWVVYLISLADSIAITVVVIGLAFWCYVLVYAIAEEKLAKKPFIVGLILFSFAAFIPSSKTVTAMIAAQYITRDNVTEAIKAGKALKDEVKSDVIDLINAIRGEVDKESK